MTDEPLEQVSPLALPAKKPARARHQPRPKKAITTQTSDEQLEDVVAGWHMPQPKKASHMQAEQHEMIEPPVSDEQIDKLNSKIDDQGERLAILVAQFVVLNHRLEVLRMIDESLFSADPDRLPAPINRRRSEDEMRRALRLLSSGERRPQDDESVLVMDDAIGEVFALRLAYANLMQATTKAYQDGLAAVKRMTER